MLFRVRNNTSQRVIGNDIRLTRSSAERRTGLLNVNTLQTGQGLWLLPCEAVHTFFMKFPIDVVYLDKKRQVRKIVLGLAPWRISGCLTAHSTLELPVGTIAETRTKCGDQLEFTELPDER